MAARRSATPTRKQTSRIPYESLHAWHKYLAAIFGLQAVVILILSVSRMFSVTTSYLGVDALESPIHGHTVLAAGSQHLFDVNLTYLVAGFLLVAAIAHGLIATVWRPFYEHDLKQGVNKIRWLEYAVSNSVMVVAIGLLVGVQDISALLMLFGLTAIMYGLELLMEVHNQGSKRPNWLSYWLGCVAGIVPWIVLAIYLVSDRVYGATAPTFVYVIFVSTFVLFAGFAANLYLQYSKVGKWAHYAFGERTFLILSLLAKTALAWQIFAGSLKP